MALSFNFLIYYLSMAAISYEYHSAASEVSHSYLYRPVAELLADVPPKALVVDMGCGNGSFLSLFRDRGWQLYGSDLSSTGIEIARASYPSINFSLANAESMPKDLANRAGQFDVVLNTEVIEHVYNPRGLLKTCHELLRQGGTLVLTTPYHGYLKNVLLALTGKLDEHFTVLWDHGHIKFWSHKTMREVLSETGFTNITFRGAGRIPWLWKSMVVRAEKQ
jgi:2-polyprenyl-3-methyl-5-hydroxy-6-metoxy-1,4-benzoquinol methylase